ncbi:hypothetical protein R1flu_009063 [Riccia fluitans]|uniref:Uncharacterized protein n=1 Tax=Riccia fluitans TaxID=41844 RepID=A0ABD1Z1H6_9MARC
MLLTQGFLDHLANIQRSMSLILILEIQSYRLRKIAEKEASKRRRKGKEKVPLERKKDKDNLPVAKKLLSQARRAAESQAAWGRTLDKILFPSPTSKRKQRIDQRGQLWRNIPKVDDDEDVPDDKKNGKKERGRRKTLLEVLPEHCINYCQRAKKYMQRLEQDDDNPLGEEDTHLRTYVSEQYANPLQWACFKEDV